MKESLVELGGLGEEKLKRLQPRSRMIRCMSKTPSLGNSANPLWGSLGIQSMSASYGKARCVNLPCSVSQELDF